MIYDNRPEPALPPAKTEDVYASPYDYPRKAPLYQDVDLSKWKILVSETDLELSCFALQFSTRIVV